MVISKHLGGHWVNEEDLPDGRIYFTENTIENLHRTGKENNLIFHCETYMWKMHMFCLFSNEMQILIMLHSSIVTIIHMFRVTN